jgi:hypothetical protein
MGVGQRLRSGSLIVDLSCSNSEIADFYQSLLRSFAQDLEMPKNMTKREPASFAKSWPAFFRTSNLRVTILSPIDLR